MKKERVFLKIICYDSLRYSSRRGIPVQSTLGEFLIEFTEFWNNFVLHEFSALRVEPESQLKNVDIAACPQQANGVDYGLFTVAVTLHLLEGLEVNRHTFSQDNISEMRKQLAKSFKQDAKSLRFLPAQTVQSCFPHWRARKTSKYPYVKGARDSVVAPRDGYVLGNRADDDIQRAGVNDDSSYAYNKQSDNDDDDDDDDDEKNLQLPQQRLQQGQW